MLLLIMAAAIGPARAQNTQTRTLTGIPQGWSVTADGQSVTANADGSYTIAAGAAVKLIPPTEVKPTVESVALQTQGALNGKFTINADGKQVYFSQGNLKYSNGTWSFHTNQYDRCFTSNGNVSSSYNASGTFDLFGWGTSGYNNKNPYMTSTNNNDYAPGINEIAGTDYDWGVYNAISNGGNQVGLWHLLTNDEWGYVFNTRSASTVNGTANARYTIASINTGTTTLYGTILFPDLYTAGTPTGVTWGTINSTIGQANPAGVTLTSCTLEGWNELESAGCVFLLEAGYRGGTTVNSVNADGGCWAGSYHPNYTGFVYNTHVTHGNKYIQPQDRSYRYIGYSVRLVQDVQ